MPYKNPSRLKLLYWALMGWRLYIKYLPDGGYALYRTRAQNFDLEDSNWFKAIQNDGYVEIDPLKKGM